MARHFRKAPDPHYRASQNPADDRYIKTEGKKIIIYPRALDITWGKDKRYWKLPSSEVDEDSVAELKQVCWLEVTGSSMENLESRKWYKLGFQVSLRPDAFGWDECNVYIMAKIGKKGSFTFKQLSLKDEKTDDIPFDIPRIDLAIQMPEFTDKTADDDKKIYFGMYEVWSKRWKGGLKIHHAFVEKMVEPKR